MSEEQESYGAKDAAEKPYAGFLEFAAAVKTQFGDGEYACRVLELGVANSDRWRVFNQSQKLADKRLAELRALTETLRKTSPKSPE